MAAEAITATYYPIDFVIGFTTRCGNKTRVLRFFRAMQHLGCLKYTMDLKPRYVQAFVSYYHFTIWLLVPPKTMPGAFELIVKNSLRPFGVFYLRTENWGDAPILFPDENEADEVEKSEKHRDKPFEQVLEEKDEEAYRPRLTRIRVSETPPDSGNEDE